MTRHFSRLTIKVGEFLKSRVGLSLLLATQIFLVRNARRKKYILIPLLLVGTGHLVGVNHGICPVKALYACVLFH